MKDDDFLDDILRDISKLPPKEREERMAELLGIVLRVMETEQIKAMRAEFDRMEIQDEAMHRTMLELIDGHLALRELGIRQIRPPKS